MVLDGTDAARAPPTSYLLPTSSIHSSPLRSSSQQPRRRRLPDHHAGAAQPRLPDLDGSRRPASPLPLLPNTSPVGGGDPPGRERTRSGWWRSSAMLLQPHRPAGAPLRPPSRAASNPSCSSSTSKVCPDAGMGKSYHGGQESSLLATNRPPPLHLLRVRVLHQPSCALDRWSCQWWPEVLQKFAGGATNCSMVLLLQYKCCPTMFLERSPAMTLASSGRCYCSNNHRLL